MTANIAVSVPDLVAYLRDARKRTLDLVGDLSDEQRMGPRLEIVNPFLWEIGHVTWFHERWILRHLDGRDPLLANADALYDSIAIAHDLRWDLPLPPFDATLRYTEAVLGALVQRLSPEQEPNPDDAYFYQLTVFHEDMHCEAFTYTRQTLGYSAPTHASGPALSGGLPPHAGPLTGDATVPGGTFQLGASPDEAFVFDNEKWAHPIEIEPFRIARAPVTNGEYAAFVEDGGYEDSTFWSDTGWQWRTAAGLAHPVYWRRDAAGGWQVRVFDAFMPLPPHQPIVHVNWYEAQAYCKWAGRRLPTEAEWEAAAAGEANGGRLSARKRRFPWGDDPPTWERANLDSRALGCLDVGALPEGDSAFGCRQMMGNIWEWTDSAFEPYPGFVIDPYKEYSEPWFGTRKVLRGGCWATRGRMLRNTWRNFFTPERNDIFAGFRTCAL